MKKTRILIFVCFLLSNFLYQYSVAFPLNTEVEMSASPKSKKSTASKKRKSASKAASASSSKTKETPSKREPAKDGPRNYNGQLMYRELCYMNNLIKNLSFGMGFNGEKSVKIIVKGNKIHINDQTMHDHLIINEDLTGYLYNDVSKEGLIIDENFLTFYKDGFNLEERKKIIEEQLRKTQPDASVEISSNVALSDRKVNYKGDDCKVKSGEIKIDQSITDVEAWYSESYLPIPNLKYFFNGLDTPGILRKALVTSQVPVPLFGTGKTANAYELVALSEFIPEDSDFVVPADIKLEQFKENGQYIKFLKNASKRLKKAKLYPKSKKKKDTKFAIESNWDFVNEWLDKKIEVDDRGITWAKVGESLLSGIGAMADISGTSIVSANSATTQNFDENLVSDSEVFSDTEVIDKTEGASENKNEEIRKKNKELVTRDSQRIYDSAIKSLRNCYDTYSKFHKDDVKDLVDEYKKEGKFSNIYIAEAQRKYRDYIKMFNEEKKLARNIYKNAIGHGLELIKRKDHDLKFDFKDPLNAAKSQLEQEHKWHGW